MRFVLDVASLLKRSLQSSSHFCPASLSSNRSNSPVELAPSAAWVKRRKNNVKSTLFLAISMNVDCIKPSISLSFGKPIFCEKILSKRRWNVGINSPAIASAILIASLSSSSKSGSKASAKRARFHSPIFG